ncbi:hypothetical protein BAUCODRAFT_473317 [Baudoinia panamericana UAMH 10762]|uniref:Uncharacterized protein n=1 Tax=Baudoinia panamericana (strain UAMH 10762) TaxID=717646 RepID=M2MXU5_BAUPA|nr:uncharacterized protein BAUCODRAFT_473317 [Baudoinia panamericana UAMH 10762]EMC96393.1 hypothetical protein BAUCODRAFT_473317 [Baudoinia panamericana UAMH 10762]
MTPILGAGSQGYCEHMTCQETYGAKRQATVFGCRAVHSTHAARRAVADSKAYYRAFSVVQRQPQVRMHMVPTAGSHVFDFRDRGNPVYSSMTLLDIMP